MQKVEGSFTFCKRICTCCEFTGQGKLVLQQVSKGDVTRDDSQRRFLVQHSVAMVEQCCNRFEPFRNNVATLR